MQTLIILGPTGSGKTGVSIKLAKRLNGEIISADSRAIYKGMDIGTAKPSREEQDGVPHYGLDLVEPGERFTVADWKAYAEEKIAEIKSRGKLPIIVGGTGLYIDALIYDYHFKTGDELISLPDKEFELLVYLIMNRNTVVRRTEIMEDLFENCEKESSRTLDVHVNRLRSKLGESRLWRIETVYGVGYRFSAV